jgi:hypothetical protein
VDRACERRLLDPNARDHEKALVREFQAVEGLSGT